MELGVETTQSVKYFTRWSRSIRLVRYYTDIVLSESPYGCTMDWLDKNAGVHCIYLTSGERTVHIDIDVGRHAALNLMK